MYVRSTIPLSTAIPKRAMKPTPAEMLNGIPRPARARMPPVAASGLFKKISTAGSRTEKFK
jgi:hypothetical protein